MTSPTPKPGDVFHVLGSITVPYTSEHSAVVQRGQTVTVTAEMIAMTTDRHGVTWLSIVEDEDAQVARWGQRKIAPGPSPEDVLWWNAPGDTASISIAREQDRERIAAISDPVERERAAQRSRQTFGRVESATVIAKYAPDAPGVYSPKDARK